MGIKLHILHPTLLRSWESSILYKTPLLYSSIQFRSSVPKTIILLCYMEDEEDGQDDIIPTTD